MIINFPSILFDRRAKRSRIVPTINKIIPPPPFESGKRYPQNVSINSNFTVDESFEARNVGFALSSETGCFSSRLRDERRNAMHLSWRRCFPETWGKHLSFPTPTGRARSLKLEKRRGRRGGGASEPKRFTREEGEGSNETMVFIFSLRQSEQPLSGKSFGVGALFIIVAGRHKRRECGKRRKTRVRWIWSVPRRFSTGPALPFALRKVLA